MVTRCLTWFVPRPRCRPGAVVALIVLTTALGCNHHRRSSLRPVYVTPSPACTSPSCGAQTVAPAPTTTITPSVVEPSVPSVVEPSASTLGAPAEPAPSATPEPTPSLPPARERRPSASPGP